MSKFSGNKLLLTGALFGFLSVLLGAIGDHAVTLTTEQAKSLATALRYNSIYAVLICALSLAHAATHSANDKNKRRLSISAALFAIGITLFSGGIYLHIFTGVALFAYFVPFGGTTLMIGWLYLAIAAALIHTDKK